MAYLQRWIASTDWACPGRRAWRPTSVEGRYENEGLSWVVNGYSSRLLERPVCAVSRSK
jgi:hypothetical protein